MSQPLLHLRISPTAEWKLRSGHPWLYDQSILQQNRPGQLGELAVLYDRHDNFLAIGLYDPNSPLRVRILHRGKPVRIDGQWWRNRVTDALARRDNLFDAQTTGYRCIHGENDGWPGLVLDRYEETLVLKLYTAAWMPCLPEVTAAILEKLSPGRLVLRLSRNSQSIAQKQFNLTDGQILHGPPLQGPVVFLESGLRFEAEVLRGQKTGFFLDQRENRRLVQSMAHGLEVLNTFSFNGGFSLYAARGGASSVTDIDISAHALESANRNFVLNQAIPEIAQGRHETIQADVFDWLQDNRSRQFDLVIVDPPSLAKRESERERAIQAYANLASNAIRSVRPAGVLVSASCSAHVSAPQFFEAVRDAAVRSRREFQELRTTAHPPDHPANFPEAHYLKCIYLRFEPGS